MPRSFEGGVTTIQSHQHVENLFAVGRCVSLPLFSSPCP